MMIQPSFVKTPQFRRFERAIGSKAYKVITLLGIQCQLEKNFQLEICDGADIEDYCDLSEDGDRVFQALKEHKLIWPTDNPTRWIVAFFAENNTQLFGSWKNGSSEQWKELNQQNRTNQTDRTKQNKLNQRLDCHSSATQVPLESHSVSRENASLDTCSLNKSREPGPEAGEDTSFSGAKSSETHEHEKGEAVPEQCHSNATPLPQHSPGKFESFRDALRDSKSETDIPVEPDQTNGEPSFLEGHPRDTPPRTETGALYEWSLYHAKWQHPDYECPF